MALLYFAAVLRCVGRSTVYRIVQRAWHNLHRPNTIVGLDGLGWWQQPVPAPQVRDSRLMLCVKEAVISLVLR
jgi:hypothetical protein